MVTYYPDLCEALGLLPSQRELEQNNVLEMKEEKNFK
jgi:hypothetical protein